MTFRTRKKHLEARAKSLRFHQTPHERRFARGLKECFPDLIVRQQHVIAPYIVDFYLPAHRLVIEIDGGQHADSRTDKIRDLILRLRGFKVLRFWNSEINTNLRGIYEIINTHLR